MRNIWLFLLVILIALSCAGIGIYYLIPGIYHILIVSQTGNPYAYHLKHALFFFGLALAALVCLRYVQPLPVEKLKTKRLPDEETERETNQPTHQP